jgi:hypothetical protein
LHVLRADRRERSKVIMDATEGGSIAATGAITDGTVSVQLAGAQELRDTSHS